MASVMLGGRKLTDFRVVDLRQELEKRGLEKSGVKAVLVERLQKVRSRKNPKNSSSISHCGVESTGFMAVRMFTLYISHISQALEEEQDGEEETAEFIPIDSIDEAEEEEESDSEEQPSSPVYSPKKTSQKPTKKTSITPVLSKNNLVVKAFLCHYLIR